MDLVDPTLIDAVPDRPSGRRRGRLLLWLAVGLAGSTGAMLMVGDDIGGWLAIIRDTLANPDSIRPWVEGLGAWGPDRVSPRPGGAGRGGPDTGHDLPAGRRPRVRALAGIRTQPGRAGARICSCVPAGPQVGETPRSPLDRL